MSKTIDYISAIPGVGKTKWAVSRLLSLVQTKEAIGVYVAPTIDLLKEVHRYLEASLAGDDLKRIRVFHSNTGSYGAISNSIKAALEGKPDSMGRTYKKVKSGDILLITHASFMNLRSFPRSDEVELLFDEARKCVTQSKAITFDNKEQKSVLSKVLEFKDLEGSTFKLAKIKVSKSEYLKLMKTVKWERRVRQAVDVFVRSAANPRLETYVLTGAKSLSMFEVVLPSKLFDGFKHVTLMSAYFEDSQMFHLLKLKGTPMCDVSRVAIPNYLKRSEAIDARYRDVSIVPLLTQSSALSLGQLHGFLISKAHVELIERLAELGFDTKGKLNVLKSYVLDEDKYELDDKALAALQLLKDNHRYFSFDPMAWFLKQSAKIIKFWNQSLKDKNAKPPLLIVNKAYEAKAESEAPTYKVIPTSVHGLNKYYEHSVVVFLAAINPSPAMYRFYQHFLPNYDVEVDHVADVCVQCVCRSSVRDTKATKPTLVLVPDRRVASLLAQKMNTSPSIRNDLSPSASFVAATMSKSSEKTKVGTKLARKLSGKKKKPLVELRQSNSAYQKTWLQDETNKKLSSLRVTRSRYSKQLTTDLTPKKRLQIEEKLSATELAITNLLRSKLERKL